MDILDDLIGPATAMLIFAMGVFGRHTLRMVDEVREELKSFAKETREDSKALLLGMHNISDMVKDNYVSKAEHIRDVAAPDTSLRQIHSQLTPGGTIPGTLSRIESSLQTIVERGKK